MDSGDIWPSVESSSQPPRVPPKRADSRRSVKSKFAPLNDSLSLPRDVEDYPFSPRTLPRTRSLKSLSRPERSRTIKRNMLAPSTKKVTTWIIFSWMVTACCPTMILSRFKRLNSEPVRQAWREKVALCFIILVLCGALGFLTFGLEKTICNRSGPTFNHDDVEFEENHVIIHGNVYDISPVMDSHFSLPQFVSFPAAFDRSGGKDASAYFPMTLSPMCSSMLKVQMLQPNCTEPTDFGTLNHCHNWDQVRGSLDQMFRGSVYYEWDDIDESDTLLVINGIVLDMSSYFEQNPFEDEIKSLVQHGLGRDATMLFTKSTFDLQVSFCLSSMYSVGQISAESIGCFASDIILMVSLIIISTLIILKFFLAVFFGWFMSSRLGKLREQYQAMRGRRKMSLSRGHVPFTMQLGGSLAIGSPSNYGGSVSENITMSEQIPPSVLNLPEDPTKSYYSTTLTDETDPTRSRYGQELYTILLVTCYSEGEEGLKSTFDSLASTMYSEDYKLLFVVADGIITGSGNAMSTPDLIINMIEMDNNWDDPEPLAYQAIGDGARQENRAKVYVGWYNHGEFSVPTVLIVKTGTEAEQGGGKPGNRGKRDSQMILMRFLQHVNFDKPMSPLEFELFQKMHYLMGVSPDNFEIVLMVDADTIVAKDSLARMVACMSDDPAIMGLCGETRIANKSESYITRIQVFEYYLSHHMTKAFESTFGAVTCLPGCFCMYRIKTPKDGLWVPIICNPEIVETYGQNSVDTLHKKNLFLLGEDRFLTTLMLKTFPRRKLMFVPRAYCKTTVPNTFSILLSQRRRWINSTIHNLLELVLLDTLCGTFCFSMQFIIFVELIGTVVLPAAITFTIVLITVSIIGPVQTIPLLLLAAVLGLPAVLILLTTKRLVYVYWLFVYLSGLPIWNLILPAYAFWHFDDFSWGQTRKVEGEVVDKSGHGESGAYIPSILRMQRWEVWESERRNELVTILLNQRRDPTVSMGRPKSMKRHNSSKSVKSFRSIRF